MASYLDDIFGKQDPADLPPSPQRKPRKKQRPPGPYSQKVLHQPPVPSSFEDSFSNSGNSSSSYQHNNSSKVGISRASRPVDMSRAVAEVDNGPEPPTDFDYEPDEVTASLMEKSRLIRGIFEHQCEVLPML